MTTRTVLITGTALCALLFTISAYPAWWPFSKGNDSDEPQKALVEIMWDDLIPDDFVQPENPFSTMSQEQIDKLMDGSPESVAELAKLEEAFYYAPVVPELDGKRVKIPAYITPLDFNGQSLLKEFLLVPYLGACIHTPPPPVNQVVYVNAPEAIEFESMYDPVWAIGTIRTETVESELAEAGYRLEVEAVVPYSQ